MFRGLCSRSYGFLLVLGPWIWYTNHPKALKPWGALSSPRGQKISGRSMVLSRHFDRICICIYIYMSVCVYVCVCMWGKIVVFFSSISLLRVRSSNVGTAYVFKENQRLMDKSLRIWKKTYNKSDGFPSTHEHATIKTFFPRILWGGSSEVCQTGIIGGFQLVNVQPCRSTTLPYKFADRNLEVSQNIYGTPSHHPV